MKYFAPTRISENIHKTPEGYLLCIGVPIGRTGVMEYAKGETPLEVGKDGIVKVARSAEELFRPETVASFEGKPFTITHPKDFVSPENWNELTKGIMQNVRKGEAPEDDGETPLISDILITSPDAIEKVESGEWREVSCGYECGYIQTGDGEGKQIEIIGNHLALVEKGRAGASYAINDHSPRENRKGPIEMKKNKLMDQIKALFAKAQDEAMKTIDEEMKEDKADKSKDADMPFEKKEEKAKDAGAYDELVAMVKDLGEKVTSLAKGASGMVEKKAADESEMEKKDDEKAKDEGEMAEKKEVAKDDVETRLTKIEAALAKLMQMEAEESEQMGDEMEEGEKSEDDEVEEEVLTGDTGDTAMRAEILAPGIALTKDVKVKALKQAYGTAEGKNVITALNGGKAPTFDSAEKVESLFVAASEVFKAQRSSELSKTKQTRDSDMGAPKASGFMTPEKMNEINAKHFGLK